MYKIQKGKGKGITFYLKTYKDIENYITFKDLINKNDDYENISHFFRSQINIYIKKGVNNEI